MKSIANQYRDLKEGKLSQFNFMRNLRMMMPQHITNVTSFNDAVKILKNKAILSEATVNSPEDVKEQWFDAFQDAIRSAVEANANIKDKEAGYAKAMKALDHVDAVEMYGMFQPGPGAVAFVSDIDDILAQAGGKDLDEAYTDEAPSYDYNGKKLYVDNQSGEPDEIGGKVSLYDGDKNEYVGIISSIDREGMISVDPDSIQPVNSDEDENIAAMIARAEEEEAGKYTKFQDFPGAISEKSYKVSKDAIPVSSLSKGDILGGSGLEVVSISAGAKTPSGKIEVTVKDPKTGKEVTKIWNKATKVTVKKDLKEAKKKKEAKAELHPNQIHPQELRMGIKVELEHTDDLDKAKKIALDHLAENPFYYTALKLAGVESPSVPKYKAPEEKKTRKKKEEVELVDKNNQMEKVKMPKVVKEAKLNIIGNEPNEVVKKAMEYVDGPNANPTLKALSDKIEFQQSRFRPDEAMLRYDYWDILPQEAVVALEKQFNVEADSDIMDDQLPINYYRLKLKNTQKPSFRPGVDLGKSFDKLKSMLEEIVREVVAETFDGRDNVTDVAGHQLDEEIQLSPEEQKIVDDILETLQEGILDKGKFMSYLKKGLITAAVIGALLGSTQLNFDQKQDIVDTVKTEKTVDQSIKDIADARFAISYYNMNKAKADKAAESDFELQQTIKEINRMIKDNETNNTTLLKSFGKNYKSQIEKLVKIN